APRLDDAAAPMLAGLVVLTLALLGVSVWRRWPDGHPLADTGATLAGVLYTGGALAFVPLLRALPETLGLESDPWRASAFVLLPLLTTWAGDSAAFFVGHAVGRTKLAPHASPGKTVEGGLAGLAGAVAAAGLVAWWGPAALGVPVALGIGLVLGAGAQVGDLAESVLKRDAGVKDSGRLLPGHGGVLDRLDALLFAFPLAWLLLNLPGVLR
ncbi:MAG: phosphatidate cytidylyltransferase, partial [Longimicrobiales bacterium]